MPTDVIGAELRAQPHVAGWARVGRQVAAGRGLAHQGVTGAVGEAGRDDGIVSQKRRIEVRDGPEQREGELVQAVRARDEQPGAWCRVTQASSGVPTVQHEGRRFMINGLPHHERPARVLHERILRVLRGNLGHGLLAENGRKHLRGDSQAGQASPRRSPEEVRRVQRGVGIAVSGRMVRIACGCQ